MSTAMIEFEDDPRRLSDVLEGSPGSSTDFAKRLTIIAKVGLDANLTGADLQAFITGQQDRCASEETEKRDHEKQMITRMEVHAREGRKHELSIQEIKKDMVALKWKSKERIRATTLRSTIEGPLSFNGVSLETLITRILHPSHVIVFKCSCDVEDMQTTGEWMPVDAIIYSECSRCYYPQPRKETWEKCALCLTTEHRPKKITIEEGQTVVLQCHHCKEKVPKFEVAKYYAILEQMMRQYGGAIQNCEHLGGHIVSSFKGRQYKICKICANVVGLTNTKALTEVSHEDMQKIKLEGMRYAFIPYIKSKCEAFCEAIQKFGNTIPIKFIAKVLSNARLVVGMFGTFIQRWRK